MSIAEKARRLAAVEPLVRGMCAKRLGTRGAEDAAQAVLEQVWRAQHQQVFDSEEAVRRYAATVARVMPAHDDRRTAPAVPTGELVEVLWADEAPGPAELVERAEAVTEARERVAALLGRLSPRERAVIEAVHLGGSSNAEVAEELGLSASGVRSASVRAMARMREQVGAVSPNPLAHKPSERRVSWDTRAAARSAAGMFPQTAGSVPVIEAAKRFALEFDRVPSRRELQELTGSSGHTAQHVVAALRAQRGEPYERTTPVRDRAQAAAREFVAEHGRAPDPGELQKLAQTSGHTARSVLRAVAGPTDLPDAAAGDQGDAPGRTPSPAADRAETMARSLSVEGWRWPTWREVAERAEVGRSTAAEVLRSLRAQTPPVDEASAAGNRGDDDQADEDQSDEDQSDEDTADPRGTTVRADRAVAAPPVVQDEPTARAGLWEPPRHASSPPDGAPPDDVAVSRARDAVARAAVTRAVDRGREQHLASGEATDTGRTRQLALWDAGDLDAAAPRGTLPDAGRDTASSASSPGARAGDDDGAD